MSEKDLVLDLQNLNVKFVTEENTVYAINGLNMQLERGKAIGLVGETGAGKTTTALSLLKLVQTPPGVVECDKMMLNGKDMLTLSEKELEAARGKDVSMNPVFTVGEQIAESVFLHENCTKEEANQRAIEMLELVGIPGERANEFPHQFSGGMKQRVVIAIALACHPQLLIADEPTTALDVTIQAQVLDMTSKLYNIGCFLELGLIIRILLLVELLGFKLTSSLTNSSDLNILFKCLLIVFTSFLNNSAMDC